MVWIRYKTLLMGFAKMVFFAIIFTFILESIVFGDEPKNVEVQRAESSSTSTTQLPPLRCFYPCPFKVDPVCATNGTNYKLFTNKCIFDSFKCEERAAGITHWNEVKLIFCKKKTNKTLETCKKNCDNHAAPICASDGHIFTFFWNNCERSERECVDGVKWRKVDLASCARNSTCQNVCPDDENYVCGSNGGSYSWFKNICLLELRNCNSTETHWQQVAPCKCVHKSEKILRKLCNQKCVSIYEPICASDGSTNKTFHNTCEMTLHNCLKCSNFTVLRSQRCS
ncbi:agrin-like isoform X2 [Hermetia illucens]|nr:agrin-like isoform X2 [Hermetia illucens]